MSVAVVATAVAAVWLAVITAFRRRLIADWREPVLAAPVLILESDDWGPGPAEDARRLDQLAALLLDARDVRGRPAVMTLGVVLAVPGAPRSASDEPRYVPRALDDPAFAPILRAMHSGDEAGVFALQLHGMEHFWPPAIEAAARGDASVREYLSASAGPPRHEILPAHLQARWIDASRLPSRPLDVADVETAAAAECAAFARLFGRPATVAVPVTFTWTSHVEAAWARHGVRVVVTPGTRNIGRDADGRLATDGSRLRNGDRGADGVLLLVRDIYFEPSLGHTAEAALQEIRMRHRLGRPALLEIHRFNFTGDGAKAQRALAEVERLLALARRSVPGLRFMSTAALGDALRMADPALVDRRAAERLRAWILRAAGEHRLRKLAWATGLAIPALVLLALICALLTLTANERRHGR